MEKGNTISSIVENKTTAIIEGNIDSLHSSVRMSDVYCAMDMPYSIVQNVLWHILQFYPYKIKPLLLLQGNFLLQTLARMEDYVDWSWKILWSE